MIRQWNRFVEDPACDQHSTERYASRSHADGAVCQQRANLRSCSRSRGPGEAPAIATATNTVSDALKRMEYPEEKRLEIAFPVQETLANAAVQWLEICRSLSEKL